MQRSFWVSGLLLIGGLVVSISTSFAASPQSYRTIERSETSEGRQHPWNLSPVTGVSVIRGEAAFQLGTHAAMPLFDQVPLFFEPSLLVGVYSDSAQFHIDAGARYDISIPDTNVKPFIHYALGPTFQTSGTTIVFNMLASLGALIPINPTLDIRLETGLFQVNGNAGWMLLAGVML